MSQITIQCQLVASETTRQSIWQLMAELNTPLINELLAYISHHADFLVWRHNGKIPAGTIKQQCQLLRSDPRFMGQPGRFYTSAIALVDYTYKSWFKIQQQLQCQLEGQRRWLEMLKSDAALAETAGCNPDELHQMAAEILQSTSVNHTESSSPSRQKRQRKSKQTASPNPKSTLANALFAQYDQTSHGPTRAAIAYLLKNGGHLPQTPEDPEQFAKRQRKAEIRVKRLTEQLDARIPKGRDLTDAQWLAILHLAATTIPQSQTEARSWQDSLLKESSTVPFPITYETNTDLTWSRNEAGRLCVHFNGMSEHKFQVYCDRRQLHWFERFLVDQTVCKDGKNQHSSSLFTLRSARISWQQGEGKGNPWQIHRLVLQCIVDTRLWTQEGTEQVRHEKAADVAKILTGMQDKGDLNQTQQAFIKRKNATLAKINSPFPRPSRSLHQGQPHIMVSVSIGLDKPATAAVVNVSTGNVLTYRSIRQLLGDNYRLLNRQRQHQRHNAHQHKIAQRQGKPRPYDESELGQYIDRLLAKAIVTLAQTYYPSHHYQSGLKASPFAPIIQLF